MADSEKNTESDDGNAKTDKENSGDKVKVIKMVTNMFSTMASNDLEALKKYLDEGDSGIEQYTTAVEYTYNISPQIFKENEDGIRQVNPDKSFDAVGLGSSSGSNSLMSSMMSTDVFMRCRKTVSYMKSSMILRKDAGRKIIMSVWWCLLPMAELVTFYCIH